MRIIQKISAVLLSVSLLIPALPASAASGTAVSGEDRVSLIIELEQPAVLEDTSAKSMGASRFSATYRAKAARKQVISEQERVLSEIQEEIGEDVEPDFTYTDVFNGFSIEADRRDIAEIESLSGVKNVYIAEKRPYASPALPADGDGSTAAKTCCDMIHATDMHARGIDGEGQAVVVIDSELDVEHEVFQQGIENPKYSKTDIENFLHDAGLGTDFRVICRSHGGG